MTVRFSHGGVREEEVPDADTLAAALAAADPDYWNGGTGMSALEYIDGSKDHALYLSLDPELGYFLMLEYRGIGRIYVENPQPARSGTGTIWPGGDEVHFDADHFVPAAAAERVLRYFLETGEAASDTVWRGF